MTGTQEAEGIDRPATVGDRNVKRIVVGVDGSPGATRALDWAAAEAERTSSLLTVVGAWAFGGIAGAVRNADDAGGNVEEAEARVAELHPEVTFEHEVSEDPAAYALIEASGDADLLVVGSRGFGGFRGLLLGSVGQHCLTHASCSVAIVRPSEVAAPADLGSAPRPIVVGVDGSGGANLALDWALNEARRTGAQLDIVASSVFPGTSGYAFTVDIGIPDAARQVVDEALAHVARVAPEVVVRGETKEDPPAVALVDASRSADLLVLGSRGLGAFRGLLLGSVSQHLAMHAHCSIVVVRGHEPG
jgi:nucleotide-binding universal stress UspA family protein